LVPFPFTSQTASKKRPAVVVSNRAYGSAKPDVIVMAITSQLRPAPALAHRIHDGGGFGVAEVA
jgi:mRNA interferase MazF